MTAQPDLIERFLEWFLKEGPTIGMVPMADAVGTVEGVTKVTWFRRKPFQVQLFIVPPHYVIPEHTHPNVDSFEVYLGGQINFSHGGRFVSRWEEQGADDNGLSRYRGNVIRVRPNDLHGGTFGPSGGVFMSVQQWLNGVEPHCVAADYHGVVMGPDHAAKVVFGKAILKDRLDARDAASAEEELTCQA